MGAAYNRKPDSYKRCAFTFWSKHARDRNEGPEPYIVWKTAADYAYPYQAPIGAPMRQLLLAAASVLFLSPVAGAAPPGDRLIDEVNKAYRDLSQYEATLTFQVIQKLGRWHNQQTAESSDDGGEANVTICSAIGPR